MRTTQDRCDNQNARNRVHTGLEGRTWPDFLSAFAFDTMSSSSMLSYGSSSVPRRRLGCLGMTIILLMKALTRWAMVVVSTVWPSI